MHTLSQIDPHPLKHLLHYLGNVIEVSLTKRVKRQTKIVIAIIKWMIILKKSIKTKFNGAEKYVLHARNLFSSHVRVVLGCRSSTLGDLANNANKHQS